MVLYNLKNNIFIKYFIFNEFFLCKGKLIKKFCNI